MMIPNILVSIVSADISEKLIAVFKLGLTKKFAAKNKLTINKDININIYEKYL